MKNREIKYRAWDKKKKIIYPKLSGFDAGFVCWKMCTGVSFKDTDNYNLMQYTGLKDKNGKEIYEGDILKNINHWGKEIIDVVEYDNKTGYYLPFSFQLTQYGYIHSNYEIIGNIYENPELL